MYSGKEDFFYERVSLAFPIDSPWIKYFDIEIKKIVRAGLIKRWKQVSRSEVAPWHSPYPMQVYWPQADECTAGITAGEGVTGVVTVTDMQVGWVVEELVYFS